jgi:hypothetical protein
VPTVRDLNERNPRRVDRRGATWRDEVGPPAATSSGSTNGRGATPSAEETASPTPAGSTFDDRVTLARVGAYYSAAVSADSARSSPAEPSRATWKKQEVRWRPRDETEVLLPVRAVASPGVPANSAGENGAP